MTLARGEPEICSVRSFPSAAARVASEMVAPAATYRAVAELFGALSDPTRFAIVHVLMNHELCTCDLASIVGVTESGVSQHLRVLRAMHIVKSRRAGKFVFYSLDDQHVANILTMGLAHQGHLDAELGEATA